MKTAILFVTTLLFMATASKVHAEVTVKVNQNITSSSSNSQSSTSDTYVRTETNGEVKEFRAKNGEDINYESDSGNVKVTVNNSVKTSTGSPTPKTLNDEAKEKVQEKVKGAKTNAQKKAVEKKNEAAKKLGEIRDTQKGNLLNRIELFFSDFKKRFFE